MAESSVRPADITYQAPLIQVMGSLADLTAGTGTPTITPPQSGKVPSSTSDFYIPTGNGGRVGTDMNVS